MRIYLLLLLSSFALHTSAQNPRIYGLMLDESTPAKIRNVIEHAPAHKAGLEAGDIIVSINGSAVGGLDNPAILKMLSGYESAALVVTRNGKEQRFALEKMAADGVGARCISGDCIKGKGRISFPNWNNYELEGSFVNGIPAGIAKAYTIAGKLIYEGTIEDFDFEGTGTKYTTDPAKGLVLEERGQYRDGALDSGTVYFPGGEIKARGRFDAQGLVEGFMYVFYRSKNCHIYCERFKNGKPWSGRAVTMMGLGDTATTLSEAYYTEGKKEGMAREWELGNPIRHHRVFRKGVMQEEGLEAPTIYYTKNDKIVGLEVKYGSDDEFFFKHITGGIFKFASRMYTLDCPAPGCAVYDMQDKYDKKIAENARAFTLDFPATASGKNLVAPSLDNLSAPAPIDKNEADLIHEIRLELDEFKRMIQYLVNKYQTTYLSNFWENTYNIRDNKVTLSARCDRLIEKYQGRVPAKYIQLFRDTKQVIQDLPYPDRSMME